MQTHLSRGAAFAVAGYTPWHPGLKSPPFMEMALRGVLLPFNRITDPENLSFTCFYTANCSLWREDFLSIEGSTRSLRFLTKMPILPIACSSGHASWCSTNAPIAYHAPGGLGAIPKTPARRWQVSRAHDGKHPHIGGRIGVNESLTRNSERQILCQRYCATPLYRGWRMPCGRQMRNGHHLQ